MAKRGASGVAASTPQIGAAHAANDVGASQQDSTSTVVPIASSAAASRRLALQQLPRHPPLPLLTNRPAPLR